MPVVDHAAGAVKTHANLGALRATNLDCLVVLIGQLLALLILEVLLGGEDHTRHLLHRKNIGAMADEFGGHK